MAFQLNPLHVFPHVQYFPRPAVQFGYRAYDLEESLFLMEYHGLEYRPIGVLRAFENGSQIDRWGVFAQCHASEALLHQVAVTSDMGFLPSNVDRNKIINRLS